MTKLLLILSVLVFVFNNCSNQATSKKDKAIITIQEGDTTEYNGLTGTWVRYNKTGFTLIEIKDTSNILYYQFIDGEVDPGKPASDRFWYYKSKATMGYWDSSAIWISTDKFRFDYRLSRDTLIEFDKMGDQGIFIKVKTDEQKAFTNFNASDLKGQITHVNKVASSEFFVLDNVDWEYSFSSISTNASKGKIFSEVAAIGDSVIKPSYADTLTLFKNNSKENFKFPFVRQ